MTLEFDIAVEAGGWDRVADLHGLVARAFDAAVAETHAALAPMAEVSLLFSDDAAIRVLNRTWRHIDKPTNVLSFPAADAEDLPTAPLLGDIAFAYETLEREARGDDKTFDDHLTHLVVHGFLHLLGYDHEVDADAETMESLESRILGRLGIADPYLEDPAAPDLGHEQH